MNRKYPAIVAAAAIALSGCGGPSRGITEAPDVKELADRAIAFTENSPTVVEISEDPYTESEAIPATPWKKYGDVIIGVQKTNFYDLLHAVGKEYGIGISLAEEVQTDRAVTIHLRYLSPVAAMKKIAEAAGYVAVYNPGQNHVTIAPRAIFSFKIPRLIFSRLAESSLASIGFAQDDEASNPSAGGDSTGSSGLSIRDKIRSIAGTGSKVNVFELTGLITVEADVRGLSAVHDFLNHYLAISTAVLDIRAAIIAVDLNEESQQGVNWEALLDSDLTPTNTQTTSAVFNNDGFKLNIAPKNIGFILSSLEQQRAVEVLAQPQISSANLQTAALFSGDRIPYLARIETTRDESGAVSTTSAESESADDAVVLEVTGDILDQTRVQLRVNPRISSVREITRFDLGGGGHISAPLENVSETNSVVVVDSGETIILGGIRSSSQLLRDTSPKLPKSGLAGIFRQFLLATDDEITQKEFWVLLNVSIQEGPVGDALIFEVVAAK